MRTQSVTLGSATFSAWMPMDSAKAVFGVGIGVTITPAAVLTYGVQHTFDDPYKRVNPISITRSGTTVTVNQTDHGLSVGDFVHVEGANTGPTDVFDGNFTVAAITDANNFTYTVSSAGATTALGTAMITTLRVRPNSILGSSSANGDTNYAFTVRAVRLNVSAWTSGKVTMTVNQGSGT